MPAYLVVYFISTPAYLVVCLAHFDYSPTQWIQRYPAENLFSSGSAQSYATMFECDVIDRLLDVPAAHCTDQPTPSSFPQ